MIFVLKSSDKLLIILATIRIPAFVCKGPVYKGPVYKGPVYKGPVYKGSVYKGPVYKGPVYKQRHEFY